MHSQATHDVATNGCRARGLARCLPECRNNAGILTFPSFSYFKKVGKLKGLAGGAALNFQDSLQLT